MKDKEAREQIAELREKIEEDKLDDRVSALEGLRLVVRYCKKCEHDTLQQRESHYSFGWISWVGSSSERKNYDYTCLTCGAKWECRQQDVCTEVKPKPAKKKTTTKSK